MIPTLFLFLLACGEDTTTTDTTPDTPSTLPEPCETPQRIEAPSGHPTGFVRYADGSVNRPTVVPVEPHLYDEGIDHCEDHLAANWGSSCWIDADCGEPARKRCVHLQNEFGAWCSCIGLCSRDSDCGDGYICLWPPAKNSGYDWPECVRAHCTTDADCPSGECGVASLDYQSERYAELGCRTPEDECRTNGDCDRGNRCRPNGNNGWICDGWHPVD